MTTRKKKTSVSVIIPAYNAEKTLPSCVDALLQQTVLPDEIILVDDGSTDHTTIIAESYSTIILIKQTNQGPAKARNNGAKHAKGDIIFFLDSDCVPEKNFIHEMLLPFHDEKVVGVQGAYRTRQQSWVARFDQLDIEYRYTHLQRAKKMDWIGSYAAAYHRKTFIAEKGFDETFPRASGEDAELSYRLSEKGMKLVFSPTAIVYHTHPATLLHYLKVKFFRAYWRTRMYVKHPEKSIHDSYTPQELKAGFFMGAFFLLEILLLGLFFLLNAYSLKADLFLLGVAILATIAFMYAIFTSFFSFTFMHHRALLPAAIFLVFLRSLVFVLGAGIGLIDRRTWE
ncbi:MAG: glycosyltransferase [Candidatus Diapherotrites archaeon]